MGHIWHHGEAGPKHLKNTQVMGQTSIMQVITPHPNTHSHLQHASSATDWRTIGVKVPIYFRRPVNPMSSHLTKALEPTVLRSSVMYQATIWHHGQRLALEFVGGEVSGE